jgi:hypothetical protein
VAFYKKSSKRRTVCRELWAALAVREKEPLGFVPECEHQTVETSSELGEEEDAIV